MTKIQKHSEKSSDVIVLVGPRPFCLSTESKTLLKKAPTIFFVDGGVRHQKKMAKIHPLIHKAARTVGDGDGSGVQMDLLKKNQNLSDLAFLLKNLSKHKHPSDLLLLGFTGGRLDHLLFVLGEINHFLESVGEKNNFPIVRLENKVIYLPSGTHQIDIDGEFSLGSIVPNQIKIMGHCDYQIRSWKNLFPLSSRGLSNKAFGVVSISNKKPLMLILS